MNNGLFFLFQPPMKTVQRIFTLMLWLLAVSTAWSDSNTDQNTPHLIIVSGAIDNGLGDYTYGYRSYKLLKEYYPQNHFTLLLYGNEQDRKTVQRVFNFDPSVNPEYIWMNVTEVGDDDIKDVVLPAEKNKIKQKLQDRQSLSNNTTVAYIASVEVGGQDSPEDTLSQLGLTPDMVINHLAYFHPSEEQAHQALLETLAGMDLDTTDASLFEGKYWLTEDVNSDSINNILSSFGWLLPPLTGYIFPLFGYHSFGASPDDYPYLGLMLSKKQAALADYARQTEAYGRVSLMKGIIKREDSEWLYVLTGLASYEQQLEWLAKKGLYHFGYMHKPFSLMEFIATTTPLSTSVNSPTYIINLPYNVLQKGSILYALFLRIMTANNIGQLTYWSEETGLISQSLDNGEAGDIKIINPFPLEKKALEYLMLFSNSPVAGCTGDHSLYDTISLGKVPFHEEVSHLYGLHADLARIARKHGYPTVGMYFDSRRPDEKSQYLTNAKLLSEWASYRVLLLQEYSANQKLLELFSPYLEP